MTTPPPTVTYILPDLAWSILLGPIMQDAPAGAVLEVHTVAMQELVEQTIADAGRADLCVRLGPAPARVKV
jgi:hypothetical protein